MNKEIRKIVRAVASQDPRYQVKMVSQRPWSMVTIKDVETTIRGRGFACVQLPDLWNKDRGMKIAFVGAVRDMLGMPSRVEKSEFLATQVAP